MTRQDFLQRMLHFAILNNKDLTTVQRLIKDGAKVEEELSNAVLNPQMVSLLIKFGASLNHANYFGKTPLMHAIQQRNLESVKLIVKAGANVNLATKEIKQIKDDGMLCHLSSGKRTPLIYAAWQGSLEIIDFLVAAKSNLKAKDELGQTACDYLAKNKFLSKSESQKAQKILCGQ
jgi:ankyrin repeat protein